VVAGKSPVAAVLLLAALTGCSQSNVERSAAEAGKAPLGIAQAAGTTVASGFYVDPTSNPALWAKNHPKDARAIKIRQAISSKPIGHWFGNWSGNISTSVSSYVGAAYKAKKTPVLVAYNIPGRDCGGASSGGAGSPAAYRTWISKFAVAIGNRPAVVVIEPDAVAQLDCMPASARTTRLALLTYATQQFKAKATKTWAYLDGGNAKWVPAATMAPRLNAAGIKNVRGFAVNVSNFYTTAQSVSYAKAVNASLSAKYGFTPRFVVDTGRNGKGSKNGEWCNPAGRKLGTTPRTGGGADLLLWVKVPGDSDGPCGTGAGVPAGQFSPDLAIKLINGT
jgi:endoglucanase